MNVAPALTHFDISTSSAIAAVQSVGTYVTDQSSCQRFLHSVFSTDRDRDYFPVGSPNDFYLTFAQAAVEEAIKQKCVVEDVEDLLANAHDRAERFMLNPNHQYFFAHDDTTKSSGGQQVAVASSVEVQVEVKADGSVKKGGKGVLAAALFRKHMLNTDAPLSNKDFVELLMKEAQLTRGGANTYAYNMKKQFEAELLAKQQVAA